MKLSRRAGRLRLHGRGYRQDAWPPHTVLVMDTYLIEADGADHYEAKVIDAKPRRG